MLLFIQTKKQFKGKVKGINEYKCINETNKNIRNKGRPNQEYISKQKKKECVNVASYCFFLHYVEAGRGPKHYIPLFPKVLTIVFSATYLCDEFVNIFIII